jgi:SNF2 family DNA or RNA helicase
MAVKLYHFQAECVDKLGTPELVSRLIGDDMGLGKTIEALVVDQRLRQGKPRVGKEIRRTLIVAPLSVHDHWRKHILMVWPGAKISTIDRDDRPAFVRSLKGQYNFYIVHYEATRLKDMGPFRQAKWFHIICDEVHRIKNKKAQQTRAIKSMSTQFKTGMSGTPADNKPQDLWSILNWLYPKVYTSYWRFVNTYCEQDETVNGRTGTSFKKVVGVNKAAIPQLRAEMKPYYVRRLKGDVHTELPPKTYTDITVDLYPRQRKAYDTMRKEMIAWVGEHEDQVLSAPVVIAQLVRLQQFALASPSISYKEVRRRPTPMQISLGKPGTLEQRMMVKLEEPSSKLDALEDIVEDNPDQSIVVFSQSRTMVELVARRLESKRISCGLYTGAIKNQQTRDDTVAAFQRGDIRVFAGTIAAGGESITLHRSSTVVFLDRHWSPAKNVQAEDRVHRIGQRDAVQVIDIIARNTIDLGRKQAIAAKWETLKYLLGDTVDVANYIKEVEQ